MTGNRAKLLRSIFSQEFRALDRRHDEPSLVAIGIGLLVASALLAACSPAGRSAVGAPLSDDAAKSSPVRLTAVDLLRDEMLRLTGAGARECGLVPLGQDPTNAWRCAQAADSEGIPYWIAIQRQGIDSAVWAASLFTPEGTRYVIGFDSNVQGGPGLMPRFTRAPCSGHVVLTLDSRAGPFLCAPK